MKITTNPIGNYSLGSVRKVQSAPKMKETLPAEENSLTNTEKEYFAKAYPNQKTEIMKYHFYNAEGKYSGVAVGNNIDRRG